MMSPLLMMMLMMMIMMTTTTTMMMMMMMMLMTSLYLPSQPVATYPHLRPRWEVSRLSLWRDLYLRDSMRYVDRGVMRSTREQVLESKVSIGLTCFFSSSFKPRFSPFDQETALFLFFSSEVNPSETPCAMSTAASCDPRGNKSSRAR
jgi:hypothetical protein